MKVLVGQFRAFSDLFHNAKQGQLLRKLTIGSCLKINSQNLKAFGPG